MELTFAGPADKVAMLEIALRRGHVSVERTQALNDAPDERMARHGASLRLGKVGRISVQTATAATPDEFSRSEQDVPVGLWVSTVSKAEGGARLARGESEELPVRAGAVSVLRNATVHTFLRASMSSCLAQVLGNASQLGAGACNEEFVHQLRVGLRRLRTALRELEAVRHGADPGWEPVLRSVFQALGRHRDRMIVLPAVRLELAAAGVLVAPSAEPEGARSPGEWVRDDAFQHTLLAMVAFVHSDAAEPSRPRQRARAWVSRRLEALHRLLRRDAKRFVRLGSLRQHRVRKRLKRLRYLSEFAAPLFPHGKVAAYLACWRAAQGALGHCNDHRIATETYRESAPGNPGAKRAVDWLKSGRGELVKRCQRALRRASRQAPFWRA